MATTRYTLAAFALALAAAGPATAAVDTGNLPLEVQSAVSGSGSVNVSVDDDGVATLTGSADSMSSRAVERTALEHESVNEVLNLIDTD